MRISELRDARVGILGFGVEARSTLRALRQAGNQRSVTILVDEPSAPGQSQAPEGLSFASDPEAALSSIDVLVRSPGFAPSHWLRVAADARRVAQTTATNLFLSELRAQGLPSIGITGSKGKSTTSTLVSRLLQASGVPTSLVGNIGSPALDALDDVLLRRTVPVIELSSYHCADLLVAPSVAVLLQLFPEHMDWHGSLEAYYLAKVQIALTQRAQDQFFYFEGNQAFIERFDPPGRAEAIGGTRGMHWRDGWFWRGDERLFSDECVHIPGEHNKRNICCAIAAAGALGGTLEGAQEALRDFEGLPFRLQDEGYRAGIRWVNDSISTAPEAAAAALRAFGSSARTLIFGGFDRGYDLGAVVVALQEAALDWVILLPTTGHRLASEHGANLSNIRLLEVPDLRAAVSAARERTPPGTVCLFSPGAPSYGFFRDFKDRGSQFSALVRELENSVLRSEKPLRSE